MHLKIEMIKLDSNISRRALLHKIRDSSDKVVSPPVSVDNIVSVASSPGLSSINESWDSGGFTFQGHHKTIGSTKGAVDKVGVVGDIVDRGEDTGTQILLSHDVPKQLKYNWRITLHFAGKFLLNDLQS